MYLSMYIYIFIYIYIYIDIYTYIYIYIYIYIYNSLNMWHRAKIEFTFLYKLYSVTILLGIIQFE